MTDRPARRPLTASERRLVAMLDRTTREDLVAGAVLLAVTLFVGSPWLWLGWVTRWIAPLGALAAKREILADRTRRGLFVLALGHGLAGVGTVAAVPQAAPLVMLVMFSDLTLAGYSERPARPSWYALCLANIAAVAVAAVSLGDWSDVPRVAPAWLFVLVLGSHGIATAATTAATARETYTLLRDHGERLRVLADRARDADREGQLEVARALSSTTGRDLAQLADLVERLRGEDDLDLVRAGAAEGSATAKRALAGLRGLSHGVFPDVLHQHGLAAALRSFDHAGDSRATVRVVEAPDDRFPPDVESAFHALVAVCLRGADPAQASVRLLRRRGHAELVVDLDGGTLDDEVRAALVDRVEGVRGTLEVTATPQGVRVHAGAPLAAAPAPPEARTDGPPRVAILSRFISSSVVTSVVGLVTTSIVWAVTGSTAVGLIDLELVVVLVACLAAGALERRGRHGAALGLLCFETAFAGIGTSATIPVFAPTAALIVMLPLVLGLPYLTREALRLIAAAQSVFVVAVIVLGIWRTGIVDAAQLPDWVGLSLLAPTAVAVGVLVVIAISEGRAAVDASNASLQAALADLLAGIDATRRGVERDLHDGAQQHLAALAIQLHVVEQLAAQGEPARDRVAAVLERVAGQTGQARAELDLLVDGTFGAALRAVGVAEALRRSAALSRRPVTVVADGADDVPSSAAMTVYFVCNEAVQNATKHAGPDARVTITLRSDDGRLAFGVEDDGRGCPPEVLLAGSGVAELVRRARDAGGDLDVTSAPGRGTALRGWVPLTGWPATGPLPVRGVVEA